MLTQATLSTKATKPQEHSLTSTNTAPLVAITAMNQRKLQRSRGYVSDRGADINLWYKRAGYLGANRLGVNNRHIEQAIRLLSRYGAKPDAMTRSLVRPTGERNSRNLWELLQHATYVKGKSPAWNSSGSSPNWLDESDQVSAVEPLIKVPPSNTFDGIVLSDSDAVDMADLKQQSGW